MPPSWSAPPSALAERYDYPHARYVSRDEMAEMLGTRRYFGGLLDRGACHLHPLNYVLGLADAALAADVRLFEHSRAVRIEATRPPIVTTEHGRVEARYVVLAMNGYLGQAGAGARRLDHADQQLHPGHRAAGRGGGARADPRRRRGGGQQVRGRLLSADADHRLLFGGGETYGPRFPSDIKSFVRRYMLRVFPQLADVAIDYGWGGTVAITRTRLPHFARLAPEVFVAHGYSGQGIALATLAGKLIAEAIAGTAERFDVMAGLGAAALSGGRVLRRPALIAGMLYYGLRDRL